ncbi:hypothetical protein N7481_000210, partial [Penicillium waksmanii]|uniref:uncharacterized protein n=1 Tax=Penicillium waksmanii TaxID=69791 RepID=UPI00254849DD
KPEYWLYTSGTGILIFDDTDKNNYSNRSNKIYNDWESIDKLLNLADHTFHRNIDQLVLEAGAKHTDMLKLALVCPPTIYGKGRGPVSGRGRQVYELAKVTLQLKKGPKYVIYCGY